MDYIGSGSDDHRSKFGILCPINANAFPGKLWRLVNDENCRSVTWNNSASGIFINPKLFKEEVLHCEEFSMFKTQNFSSFVRQLNLYGFRKLTISNKDRHGQCVSKEMQVHHFQHPCFLRRRPDMLNHVKRAGARKRNRSLADSGYVSDNAPPGLLLNRRSEGVPASKQPSSGRVGPSPNYISSQSMSKRPISLAEADRRLQFPPCMSYRQYDAEGVGGLSPSCDVVRPTIFPSAAAITLHEEQHPFRRAGSGLLCELSLTWMANVVKGSLTSDDFGTSPETLQENGQLKRLVLIPDGVADFSSGLQPPSSRYLESFRPKIFHPDDTRGGTSLSETANIASPTLASLSDHHTTTVSWSSRSPITTTGYESLLDYVDDYDGGANDETAGEAGEPGVADEFTPSSEYVTTFGVADDEEIEGGNDLIVIKVDPEETTPWLPV